MVVAVVNIEIPRLLGSMVDIVTKKLMNAASTSMASRLEAREHEFEYLIRGPVVRLVGLYLAQVGNDDSHQL